MLPLRVGFLTTSYPRFAGDMGGHFVRSTAAALAARGHHIVVEAPQHRNLQAEGTTVGIEVRWFRYAWPDRLQVAAHGGLPVEWPWLRPRAAFLAPALLFGLARATARLRRQRCDVLHAHWVQSALAALWSRNSSTTPVVVSIWGSDLTLARNSGFVRRLLRRADALIVVGRGMREEARSLGVPASRIVVVQTAIDPLETTVDRPEARRRLGLPEHPTVLFLGRLAPVKGPDVLVEATSRGVLAQTGSQLVIVGAGPLASHVRRAAAQDPARIILRDTVNRSEVGAWLGAADLLVLPSRSEGLPHAVLEAFSVGVPVLASAVGGVPEVVVDGDSGWLVEPGCAVSLERALRGALSDPAELRRRGAAARAAFERGAFNWSRVAREVEGVYAMALGAPNPSGERE
jgi:glycosyltransferase involved in cell wall biosynthesis